MRVLRWLVALSLIVGLMSALMVRWARPDQAPRSIVFHGGAIVTMASAEEVEAISVREGRIEHVGDVAEVRSAAGGDAELIDLHGATLMPGFIEPHTHPLASAMLGAAIDVSGFTHGSRNELMATLSEATGGFTLQPWIIAFGWDPIMLRGLTPPTLKELDALSPDKPLVVLTQAMHEAFANSAALAAAGISSDTPDPPGGSFGRNEGGELTGEVLEVNAINYLLRALPAPPAALTKLMLRWQLAEYASQGVTTIGVLGMVGRAEDPLGMLRDLSMDASVPVRSVVYALPKDVEPRNETSGSANARFTIRGVKLWVDGSPYTGGAAFAEPYENTELTRDVMHLAPGHVGPLNYDLDELTELFSRFHEAGYRLAFHTQGERAIALVLDAAESVLQTHPWKDHRHRLEHNALITMEQIRRAKSLGLELSFFTDHIYYYGDRLPEIVGQRAERYMPVASAFRAGHRATIHSDNPMTPVRPLRVIRNAVLRTPKKGGQALGVSERLTVRQALEAMTINAAWQLGVEAHRGSLEPGKAADLLVLSRNPLETPAEELDDIKVLGTWIDGQPVDTRKASLPNLKIAARALWEWGTQR